MHRSVGKVLVAHPDNLIRRYILTEIYRLINWLLKYRGQCPFGRVTARTGSMSSGDHRWAADIHLVSALIYFRGEFDYAGKRVRLNNGLGKSI
jgi:hypothetical protein